jgi:hypothetical protein
VKAEGPSGRAKIQPDDPKHALGLAQYLRTIGYNAWIEDTNGNEIEEKALKMAIPVRPLHLPCNVQSGIDVADLEDLIAEAHSLLGPLAFVVVQPLNNDRDAARRCNPLKNAIERNSVLVYSATQYLAAAERQDAKASDQSDSDAAEFSSQPRPDLSRKQKRRKCIVISGDGVKPACPTLIPAFGSDSWRLRARRNLRSIKLQA